MREGKGFKDRVTMLPEAVVAQLKAHLAKVKALHDEGLTQGFGEVYLPFVLDKKYPNVHGRHTAPDDETRHARFPLPSPLPQAGEGASESLREVHVTAGREWGWQYIFPSRNLSVDPRSDKSRRHHVDEKGVQRAVKQAVRAAGVSKPATPHTFRHSFATHLSGRRL